jgi:hypothetical protein
MASASNAAVPERTRSWRICAIDALAPETTPIVTALAWRRMKPMSKPDQNQIDRDISTLNLGSNMRDHVVVKAAYAMVQAHANANNETLRQAVDEVHAQFPELTFNHLVLLWIGINAKDRS